MLLNILYRIIYALSEQQVLSYNGKGIQVVSLGTGLVGGDTIQPFLRSLEDLMSKVPIVHVEDVIEAHIFAMQNSHINGRFLCAAAFLKSAQIASLAHKLYAHITIPPQYVYPACKDSELRFSF